MTGPAEGKIPINVELIVGDRRIPCDAYIHVKGYARAMVTHLDLEGFDVCFPQPRIPAVVIGKKNSIVIILLRDAVIGGVRTRKIRIVGLSLLDEGEKSGAYVGAKELGVYIGFRREVVRRLEDIARKLRPDLFASRDITSFLAPS